jgi:hypothetical protein
LAWLPHFLLGRPGSELSFDVNPKAAQITRGPVQVLQRNLEGDLKKSVLKRDVPIIKINSSYLTFDQQNAIASLAGIPNTFLSFRCRDDWQLTNDWVQVLTSTSATLRNSSATRLSSVLVNFGLASQITIVTPFLYEPAGGFPYGEGGFGEGGFGEGEMGFPPESFDPGAVTYDDLTRIVSWANPVADITRPLYISYRYQGWLVDMQQGDFQAQGGWIDRMTYDIQLVGA